MFLFDDDFYLSDLGSESGTYFWLNQPIALETGLILDLGLNNLFRIIYAPDTTEGDKIISHTNLLRSNFYSEFIEAPSSKNFEKKKTLKFNYGPSLLHRDSSENEEENRERKTDVRMNHESDLVLEYLGHSITNNKTEVLCLNAQDYKHQSFKIGRSRKNNLVLKDPLVSGNHV